MSQQPTPLSQTTSPKATAAPPDFNSVPINDLESSRIKLLSLTRSLRKLQEEISRASSMPRWESLQNQYNIAITQLNTLSTDIFDHYDTLSSRNVYPISTFPTTQQEGLLNTLLRKRPNPEASEWIEQAEKFTQDLGVDVTKFDDQDENFVQWCLEKIEDQRENHNFFSVFTQKEIELGLSKKDHDFKISKEKDTANMPTIGMDVDHALRFMYRGE